jgi:hypothetical protein
MIFNLNVPAAKDVPVSQSCRPVVSFIVAGLLKMELSFGRAFFAFNGLGGWVCLFF